MDAMLHGSLWDPEDDVKENVGLYVNEVGCCVALIGNALTGTGGQNPEARWAVAVYHIPTTSLPETAASTRRHMGAGCGDIRRFSRHFRVFWVRYAKETMIAFTQLVSTKMARGRECNQMYDSASYNAHEHRIKAPYKDICSRADLFITSSVLPFP
jgi:hypothetical protein